MPASRSFNFPSVLLSPLFLLCGSILAAGEPPAIDRLFPPGGQRGTSFEVKLTGKAGDGTDLSSLGAELQRGDLARQSLEDYGALILARDEAEAAALTDMLAPEHLHISMDVPERMLSQIQNAGAIFMGHFTPVALGDYIAGPSHVLPTGGTARFANGLASTDFIKRSSIIHYNAAALRDDADHVRLMAEKEGLTAHSASVDIRLK